MDKDTFLAELRGYLHMLEDNEQQDILEEYSQHIDMKLQTGLSEDEAIRDFGSIKELAADILQAYHVKMENGANTDSKAAAESGESSETAAAENKKTSGLLAERLKRRRAERAERAAAAESEKAERTEPCGRKKGIFSRLLSAAYRALKRVCGAVRKFIKWCLHIICNTFWVALSLFFALGTVFLLLCFGTLSVLMLQGYPLVGFWLMSLGGCAAFGALCCAAFGQVRKKSGASIIFSAKRTVEAQNEEVL